jgi:hypothetical protein
MRLASHLDADMAGLIEGPAPAAIHHFLDLSRAEVSSGESDVAKSSAGIKPPCIALTTSVAHMTLRCQVLGSNREPFPHWVGEAPSEASHLLELQPTETDYRISRKPQFLIRPSLMPGRAIRATCRSLLRGASWESCALWKGCRAQRSLSLR